MMNTAEKIRRQRRLKDMKQEDLAGLIGVSLKTVQRWENGERSPRLNDMQKIAEGLNIPINELLDSEVEDNKSLVDDVQNLSDEKSPTELVYEWGGKNRIALPNTPETRAMFERLVLSAMTSASAATA